ncbi:3'-5' exonuclease [Peribacillus sp. NPDC094092]|uniref:3'-5' exonuclease n=1 Tax=Peribacillus sp. NPDC094092 TaxID=3390611 RepID=UPI003D0942DA
MNNNSKSKIDSQLIRQYFKHMDELLQKGETNVNHLSKLIFEFPKVKKEMDDVQKEEILGICGDLSSWIELHDYYLKLKKQQNEMEKNVRRYHYNEYNVLYLLTIHSSKGLAFSNVFIIGAYDGGIPSGKSRSVKNRCKCCKRKSGTCYYN